MRIQVLNSWLLALLGMLAVSFSSEACAVSEPLDEELSLAHFWTFSVGDKDFGIREWRYSGNPSIGKKPRSFTTFFLGWVEFDARLPALTVGVLSVLVLGAVGFLIVGGWNKLNDRT
jgi:hypothetical protein